MAGTTTVIRRDSAPAAIGFFPIAGRLSMMKKGVGYAAFAASHRLSISRLRLRPDQRGLFAAGNTVLVLHVTSSTEMTTLQSTQAQPCGLMPQNRRRCISLLQSGQFLSSASKEISLTAGLLLKLLCPRLLTAFDMLHTPALSTPLEISLTRRDILSTAIASTWVFISHR